MKLQPCSAASANDAASANCQWIEHLVLKMLSVLILDRFGDYMSDQVRQATACLSE